MVWNACKDRLRLKLRLCAIQQTRFTRNSMMRAHDIAWFVNLNSQLILPTGDTKMDSRRYNATWWSKDDDSAWDKVKAAFQRDWTQTKHDFGGKQPDLNQDVPDTVKQAAGQEHIPPPHTPNFDEDEPAFRFGYGARRHYGKEYPAWDGTLAGTLQNDWSSSSDPASWTRVSAAIRRGYEYDHKHLN